MSIQQIFHRTFKSFARSFRNKHAGPRRALRHRTIALEPLEDRQLLAVFTVNSVLDTVDANVGDGLALDAAGNTTLRAAVMEANATAGADLIELGAGTYDLTIAGFGEDGAATGDLDIADDLTIAGGDATTTILDATAVQDRLFDLHGTATVHFSGLTITGGMANNSGSDGGFEDYGGAIRADYDTNWTLTGTVLTDNSAPNAGFGMGGAIASRARTLAIDTCVLVDNSSAESGGALYTGGTVEGERGTVTVTDSTFSGNSAASGGAILSQSIVTVQSSTFSANNASVQGGAVDNDTDGGLTLVNSTLSGNQAPSGGAIVNDGTLDLLNSTIASNSASANGGGILINSGAASVENTIVADNTAGGSGPDVFGTVSSLGHNLVGDTGGSTGFGATGDLLNVDPLLGPLADNGGPTQTHSIPSNSPADDGANTSTAPAVDQRGIPRPCGAAADIGAYERINVEDLVIDAGGPYGVALNGVVTLEASADPLLAVASFAWDFDEDGQYDDATGATPVFDAAGLGDGTIVTLALQVTDIDDGLLFDTATVEVHGSWVQHLGTAGDDTIIVTPGLVGGVWHAVDVNGVVSSYDPALIDQIHIDGLGGSDTVTINGTDQDEAVALAPGSADVVVGGTYEVHALSAETVNVYAGGGNNDQVTMTGSEGSNRLYSFAEYTAFVDSPQSYSFRAEGFDSVTVDAPVGDRNYAFLYDSPGADTLTATPAQATLDRAAGSSDITASGFERVYAYATGGGVDAAAMIGSDTLADRFYGYADYSILTESRRTFYFYARGFATVTADSPSDASTYAYLYDSEGNDTFTADPTDATIDRPAPWPDTTASGFDRIYAYSTLGGSDTADLTGSLTGNNTVHGYATYSTLTGTAFYHYARGFATVTADSPSAGTNRAYLYDSDGDDTFTADPEQATMEYAAGGSVTAAGFNLGYARSTYADDFDIQLVVGEPPWTFSGEWELAPELLYSHSDGMAGYNYWDALGSGASYEISDTGAASVAVNAINSTGGAAALGLAFGGLTYNSREWDSTHTPYGPGWSDVDELPLMYGRTTTILVRFGAEQTVRFDAEPGGGYTAANGAKDTLVHDSPNGLFVLTAEDGTRYEFYDHDQTARPPGTLARAVGPGGATIEVTEWTAAGTDGRIAEVEYKTTPDGQPYQTRVFEYVTIADTLERIGSVTLWDGDTSTGTVVRRMTYGYYGSGQSYGLAGDLKTTLTEEWNGSAFVGGDTNYFRYYTTTGGTGFAHGLKRVLLADAYAEADQYGDGLIPPKAVEELTDVEIAPFTDFYYEYDNQHRMSKQVVFSESNESDYVTTLSTNGADDNHWTRKTVETRLDGATSTVYTNYLNQTLLADLYDPSSATHTLTYN